MTAWQKEEIAEPHRLVYHSTEPGLAFRRTLVVAAMSMIVLGAGLLVLRDHPWFLGDFPWWVKGITGIGAVVQGVWLLAQRPGLRVALDRAAGTVTVRRRLLGPGGTVVRGLDAFHGVTLTDDGDPTEPDFVIRLDGPRGESLALLTTADAQEARSLATEIADFLGLGLAPARAPSAPVIPPPLDRETVDSWPSVIQVHDLSQGVHYVLPRRPLRVRLFYGVAPIGVSLALAGGMVGLITAVAPNWGAWLLFLAWPSGPILLVCLWGVIAGLYSFTCHTEVRLRGTRLEATERAGPIAWWRRRPLAQVRRLAVVVRAPSREGTAPSDDDLADLIAQCEGARPLWLAPLYPRGLLSALAKDLAQRSGALVVDSVGAAPMLKVAEEWHDFTGGPRDHQPAGSLTVVERGPHGLTLRGAPPGIWRTSGGLFGFGLLWCTVCTLITAVMVFFARQANGLLPMFLALLVFWAVGLGLVLPAIHTGRRRVILFVSRDELTIQQRTLFGSRRHRWGRNDLADIHAHREVSSDGDGGSEIVYALVVRPRTGAAFILDSGWLGHAPERQGAEMEWIATELRQALALPAGP